MAKRLYLTGSDHFEDLIQALGDTGGLVGIPFLELGLEREITAELLLEFPIEIVAQESQTSQLGDAYSYDPEEFRAHVKTSIQGMTKKEQDIKLK